MTNRNYPKWTTKRGILLTSIILSLFLFVHAIFLSIKPGDPPSTGLNLWVGATAILTAILMKWLHGDLLK